MYLTTTFFIAFGLLWIGASFLFGALLSKRNGLPAHGGLLSISAIAIVCGLAVIFLSGCATTGSSSSDAKTTLANIKAGYVIVVTSYDAFCADPKSPKFCRDPNAIDAENQAKLAVEAAFNAADAAIAAGDNVNPDTISTAVTKAADAVYAFDSFLQKIRSGKEP
jgi:hypothetical protein